MGFNVELLPTKEEVLIKSDDECREQAQLFKTIGGVYYDPEFLPIALSLGDVQIDTGDSEFGIEPTDPNDAWNPPHLFPPNIHRIQETDEWHVWNDPWPFHVCQGSVGNCWLMAVLMTIARRKELLEQIVPKRDYTMETGIVQIRLLIDGKWQMIKTDYHLPPANIMLDRFAAMPRKQTWIAFIEKAFAKVKGSYGKLSGGTAVGAFEQLTGAYTRQLKLDKNMDIDKLWEQIVMLYSSGFLMAPCTPNYDDESEEAKYYLENGICHKHAYSLLDIKEYMGHRLIQIGNTNFLKWTGKWSLLPSYETDITQNFNIEDRASSSQKIFWMDISDFLRFFSVIDICEYREGWNEQRIRQTIQRKSNGDTQILRLDIIERCELVIEVTNRPKNGQSFLVNLFLSVHRSTLDNQLGESIISVSKYYDDVATGSFFVDPGTYLVIMAPMDHGHDAEYDWVIRSPTSMDRFSFHFVTCPFSFLVKSVQQFIQKNGQMHRTEDDDVIFYTWKGDESYFVMCDNYRKYHHLRLYSTLTSPNLDEFIKNAGLNNPWPVPPMSRCIIGFMSSSSKDIDRNFNCDVNLKFKVRSVFWKWFDWMDSWAILDDMESSIPLK